MFESDFVGNPEDRFSHDEAHLDTYGSHGGDTLIFSYIRRLRSFFGVKILNFNIFGVFQKNKNYFGHKDFVDIFGITKLDYI